MQVIEHLERFKLLIILFLVLSLKAQLPVNFNNQTKVYSGIANILNENYELAKRDFKLVEQSNPGSPLPVILYTGALIFEREHFGDYFETKEIDSLIYAMQDSCETLLEENPDSLWYNYLMALTKTYESYWKLFQSNYIDGFADGYEGLQYFEKCLEIDSTFTEARVAIGNYQYWSSVKTKSFHWLPFIDDQREVGLEALEIALTEKFLNRDFALLSLIFAYIEEERFIAAQNLAESLLKKYPKSSKLKWALATIHDKMESSKAISLYKDLISLYEKENLKNPSKLIELKNSLADLEFRLENYNSTLNICNEILTMPEIDKKYQLQIIPLIKKTVALRDSANAQLTALPQN